MKASERRKRERDRQHIHEAEVERLQFDNQQESARALEKYVLNDGLSELDLQISQLKRWLQEKRYSQAYVKVGDLIKLLHWLRRPIKNLEGKTN